MLAKYSIRTKIIAVVAFLLVAMTGMGLLCGQEHAGHQRQHGGHLDELAAERPRARRPARRRHHLPQRDPRAHAVRDAGRKAGDGKDAGHRHREPTPRSARPMSR